MRSTSRIASQVLALMVSVGVASCNSSDESSPYPKGCTPVGAQAKVQSLAFEMPSHIPAAVRKFADQGAASNDQQLDLTVVLAFNREDELDERIVESYTPGAPGFKKFLTPAEFHERYAPTQSQRDQVQSYLESQGFTGFEVNENGYMLSAKASASAASSAFETQIRRYKDSHGRAYFAPAFEPRFPSGLGIRAVHGLHNVAQFKSFAHQNRSTASLAVSAQSGSGSGGGLTPQDIKQAYAIPSQVSGSGQTIAIVALDGYTSSDITAYASSFGIREVPRQNVLVDGASGAAGSSALETTLDIELVNAMAPGASKILVYEAPNDGKSLLDLYSRIANDNAAQIVTTSWGGAESLQSTSFLEAESGILKQMAAQGQTVFAASGDSGAYGDGTHLGVIDPASQPFVVGVGGTRLYSSGGSYVSETTWNNGSPSAGASGGGVSSLWVSPSWQNGFANSQNRGSGSMRNVPDVALNADPMTGYSIVYQNRWATVGGTSAAAPLWAGFTALVNEQRSANGLSQIGFLNPVLYNLARTSRYSSDFNDVRDGSSNLYYPSVQGYDMSTGLGTLKGQTLFADLSVDRMNTAAAVSCN